MEVELTQGYKMIIDEEDYDMVKDYKLHVYIDRKKDLYYALGSKKVDGKWKSFRMHRVIMGNPKGMVVDHENGNGLDNRRSNLRICTIAENARNRKSNRNSTSKYLGVSMVSREGKWVSVININYKIKSLGHFDTELEAAIIYNITARKYFGEFARPNELTKITY